MKTKKMLIYATMVCFSLVLFAGCKGKAKPETSDNKNITLTGDQLVQRGNYLVTTIGCHDCHSPKKLTQQGAVDIPELMFSGYQADQALPPVDKSELEKGWLLFTVNLNSAVGPWGVSFAANLTSDQTGIGSWPEENFIRALKQGKYKGMENGRPLLPPMPWQNFGLASDDDLKAMFAYFKTTKPVKNVVPMPIALADLK